MATIDINTRSLTLFCPPFFVIPTDKTKEAETENKIIPQEQKK